MKEISRIHIAKISYDIEVAAKKTLENYMKALEAYSNDAEIINDIEIRITEILSDRGVNKNDVISAADVTALKQQLGEPSEFMSDGDIALGPDETSGESTRKLYRNTDAAVLGGVLSGVAAFFKINPLWARLVFIVLLFVSFGTAILVYIVLWIAIPPARTAADKLQMEGKPVTVGSIRALNESEVAKQPARNSTNVRRVATLLIGIACIISATLTVIALVVVAIAASFGDWRLLSGDPSEGLILAAFILAYISGLLLTILFVLGAYASFSQKVTRRVLVSICVVVVLGLASFGTAIGLVEYRSLQRQQQIEANMRETTLAVPAGLENATSLVVDDIQGLKVTYIVTADQPKATLKSVVQEGTATPEVSVSFNDKVLKISAQKTSKNMCEPLWWCGRADMGVTVYGPAMPHLAVNRDANLTYQAGEQNELRISADKDSSVVLSAGNIETLKVTAKEDAVLTAYDATVRHLNADMRMSANLEFGTVETLVVTDANSCPARMREARVSVMNVTSGTMTMNGAAMPAQTTESGCSEITIEGEHRND
jgi:phage shock protein PspC (stress-responsive transcriptional regulator)